MYTASLSYFQPNPYQPKSRHRTPEGGYTAFVTEQLAPTIIAHKTSRPKTRGLLHTPVVRLVDKEGQPVTREPVSYPVNGDISSWLEITKHTLQVAIGFGRFCAFDWLSAQDADYASMPFELAFFTDQEMGISAFTENNARHDLNPMERYEMVRKMIDDFGWSQTHAAEMLKLSEATVSNILRLGHLPEAVQTDVQAGKITERQAVAMVPLYQAPAPARVGRGGYYSEKDILDSVRNGASSDDIRRRVESTLANNTKEMNGAFPLDFHFEGDGVVSAICQGCAYFFQHKNKARCAKTTCFEKKASLYANQALAKASEESGIPVQTEGDRRCHTFYGGANDLLHSRPDHPGILEQGCQHLRLYRDTNPGSYESLDASKYPREIVVACFNPDGKCACALAAKQAQQQTDPQQLARQREQAERQAQEEQLVAKFTAHALEPTQKSLLDAFQSNDVRAWRLLVDRYSNAPWSDIAQWDLAKCQTTLIQKLIEFNNWSIVRDAEGVLQRLNDVRARLGLEPLALPEEENGTPAEKLERKLQRIERWMERISDGEIEVAPEAVRGNLVNLGKLRGEWEQMPADEQTPFLIRINNLMEALNDWLVEADAESDEEEEEEDFDEEEEEEEDFDEEEDLEEAYA